MELISAAVFSSGCDVYQHAIAGAQLFVVVCRRCRGNSSFVVAVVTTAAAAIAGAAAAIVTISSSFKRTQSQIDTALFW